MRDQAADRSAGRDTVAMLDGHTMRHETTHGKACEEDATYYFVLQLLIDVSLLNCDYLKISILIGLPHRGVMRIAGEPRAGNPTQDSCLKNPIDRGTWQATVHRVTKSRR